MLVYMRGSFDIRRQFYWFLLSTYSFLILAEYFFFVYNDEIKSMIVCHQPNLFATRPVNGGIL